MEKYHLPTITMIGGTTNPISFRVTDFSHMMVDDTDLTAELSVSHYINDTGSPVFVCSANALDGDILNFTIASSETVDLRGKFVYQLHLSNGVETEIYEGYLIILANRNKDAF